MVAPRGPMPYLTVAVAVVVGAGRVRLALVALVVIAFCRCLPCCSWHGRAGASCDRRGARLCLGHDSGCLLAVGRVAARGRVRQHGHGLAAKRRMRRRGAGGARQPSPLLFKLSEPLLGGDVSALL